MNNGVEREARMEKVERVRVARGEKEKDTPHLHGMVGGEVTKGDKRNNDTIPPLPGEGARIEEKVKEKARGTQRQTSPARTTGGMADDPK